MYSDGSRFAKISEGVKVLLLGCFHDSFLSVVFAAQLAVVFSHCGLLCGEHTASLFVFEGDQIELGRCGTHRRYPVFLQRVSVCLFFSSIRQLPKARLVDAYVSLTPPDSSQRPAARRMPRALYTR